MASIKSNFSNTGSKDVAAIYRQKNSKKISLIIILLALLVLSIVLSAGIGTIQISPSDTITAIGHAFEVLIHNISPDLFSHLNMMMPSPDDPQAESIVVGIRLPRIFLAVLAGISLAVAGTVMQGLLRNPLVSPFTLGLSSSAAFGAAVAIVIGPAILGTIFPIGENTFIIISAFTFGWLSMFLVYGISRSRGTTQATLILAGVVIGYIFSAGVLALKYISNNEKLRELVVWLMGGMWGATWDSIILLLPICAICFVALELRAWDLNALAAGDDVAKNIGINVEKTRLLGLIISTFAASCCLAFTGIIGFVGLMAPHICRMLIGNDYRYLIPCSALLGALILLISDTAARTIMSPIEIPVGIIMYVTGGLFFLYLIRRGKGRGLY